MSHHEFEISLNITTTNGHLSVDMYPLEIDGAVGHDEALANSPEVIEQLKVAVFQVLRQLEFKGS